MYGADGVEYLPEAERQIRQYTALGLGQAADLHRQDAVLAVGQRAAEGSAVWLHVTIREVRAYTGAGFLTPISGEIMTMPGLPTNAAYHTIDLDEDGEIVGLF